MKLPDGFEGVVIPTYQNNIETFKKIQSPISLITFILIPFFYAFTESNNIFRYVLYPMFFVAPWAMMAIQKDKVSFQILHLLTPFTGFVFLFIAMHEIFSSRKCTTAGYVFRLVKFSLLTILTVVTPLVPFSIKNGLLIQFAYPFLTPDMAFGIKYYKYLNKEHYIDFVVGSIAIPVFAHVFYLNILCIAINFIKLLLSLICKTKNQLQQEVEKTDDVDVTIQ